MTIRGGWIGVVNQQSHSLFGSGVVAQWAKCLASGLVLCVASFGLSGCNSGSDASRPRTVAIVDLDKIAANCGLLDEFHGNLQTAESGLNTQLVNLKAKMQEKLSEKTKELDRAEAAELAKLKQEVNQLKVQLEAQLNQAQTRAREQLSGHRAALIAKIKDDLRPVVTEVAKEKGIDIVLSRNLDTVYVASPNADLTEAVIAKMAALGKVKAPAAKPAAPQAALPTTTASAASGLMAQPAVTSASPKVGAPPHASSGQEE
jgi:Skp family chaperone for outer membrane proteins